MFQQILKLSNGKIRKEAKPSQSAEIKRTKRKQSTDGNVVISADESKSKRMKLIQVKKINGKGRPKKAINASDWPNHNEVTHHASPKIWDMFERFQNFAQRRVLKRHPSGLLETSVDETTQKHPKSKNQLDNDQNMKRSSERTSNQSSEPFPVSDDKNESSIGGDRKRRCVEISDYEDELKCPGQRVPQPASAFKPKCLNFDNVEDS
ncbi:uncharacterized protein LOC119071314 isoform X2 [Bradysia coprophila]|uniref:uncharacterized protein LOC119071314 isoform X2 n=1 Tax=Bradysia coprophila TaxID=38358 RepID=UPI00187DB8D6|nr:uncharacterized protein LOC119071314 isoform X2 [Bradysia coprophila]